MDKIYIVGGGASGMMAAIQAKTKDNEVILLEKTTGLERKFSQPETGSVILEMKI